MSRNKIISENSYILTKYLSQVATLALHHAQCNLQPMVLYGTLRTVASCESAKPNIVTPEL